MTILEIFVMSNKLSIELINDISELDRVNKKVEEFSETNELPPNLVYAINLSLEETLTNIIYYAFDDEGEHQILIRIEKNGNEISLEVEDDGRPFNPLEHEDPDTTLALEDRPIGGLGIKLVKEFMDIVDYERKDDKNLLTMKKASGMD